MALSVQRFFGNNVKLPVLHPHHSPDRTPSSFFCFPGWKKLLKGKHFADVEELKQKMAEALKGINNDEFKNCLRSGKNTLIAVVHQMESTLKGTEV